MNGTGNRRLKLGIVGIGVYPAPWVAAAMRVASTLF